MKTRILTALFALVMAATLGADAAWKWTGTYGDKAVEMLIIGDIQVHTRRADPTTAFNRMRDTLKKADLVYANLEGLLVKSVGTKIDIPDKPEWTHPGPDGVKALKASNVAVVGVANNVASGRANILKSLSVLDANGMIHTGAGKNIDEAHKPAIVERKGVKIGFLQYTARWYQDKDMIASATEAGVARIKSLDGITIDPGDLDRAARRHQETPAARRHRRRVASQSRWIDAGAIRRGQGHERRPGSHEDRGVPEAVRARGARHRRRPRVRPRHAHHAGRRDVQRQADPLRDRPLEVRSARL